MAFITIIRLIPRTALLGTVPCKSRTAPTGVRTARARIPTDFPRSALHCAASAGRVGVPSAKHEARRSRPVRLEAAHGAHRPRGAPRTGRHRTPSRCGAGSTARATRLARCSWQGAAAATPEARRSWQWRGQWRGRWLRRRHVAAAAARVYGYSMGAPGRPRRRAGSRRARTAADAAEAKACTKAAL